MEKDRNIILVTCTSHIDMPWVWRLPESIDVWKNTSKDVLDLMDKYPDFNFVQGSAQGYKWMEDIHPYVFEGIKRRVADGRWKIVGGMWVEPDCNMPSGESLVRNILYGKRYFRERFGVDPKIAFIPDSFGYAASLPQIFVKSGFDYFITQKLRWNMFNEFPYDVFNWIGIDGSRIRAYMPYRYDETLPNGCEERLAREFKKYKDKTGLNELLLLLGMGDHGGGPNEPMLLKSYQMKIDGVDGIVHSDLEGFLSAIEYSRMPSYEGELYLENHQGVTTTNASMKKLNRQTEVMLEEVEKFSVMALMEDNSDYPREEVRHLWENLALNQFHDTLSGTCIRESHEDAEEIYRQIQTEGNEILGRSLSDLARSVDTSGNGRPVLVFNPLSWERNDLIVVRLEDGESHSVIDTNGNVMLSNWKDGELSFVAEDLPSVGYKTFWIRKGEMKDGLRMTVGDLYLENASYKVEIDDQTGNIKRLFDKRRGFDILQRGKQGNVLQAFHDMPPCFDAWNIGFDGIMQEVENVEDITLVENNPIKATIRITKNLGNSKISQYVSLYNHIDRIDVRNSIDWHEKHTLLKAAFPVNVFSDRATYEIPYGVIERPTTSENSIERAKSEVTGGKWADLSDPNYGVSILNDCKYGWDIKGNLMRITLLRSPNYPDPDPSSLHMPRDVDDNNAFTDRGLQEFTYSIYPHAGNWRDADTVRRAYELNYHALAHLAPEHSGKLPSSKSFAIIDPKNVILSVMKPAEESGGLVFRFYETYGRDADVRLKLPKSPSKVYETDLMENKISQLRPNTVLNVPSKRYEIKTVLAEF